MLEPLEVLPRTYQITLPLPFELSSVNVYLIPLDEAWMLVDCGLGTQESFDVLQGQLQSIGVEWSSIREILLTHTHPDHVGQAKRLLELTGARLSLQRDELDQLLKIARTHSKPGWLDDVLVWAGVPQPLIERIEVAFMRMKPNFPELTPDRILEGGEVLQTAIGPLELILTPGHSPGHLALYSEPHRTLFSGDHVLQTITPNIGWLPERDALGEFFDSMERVVPLDLVQLLPGHGHPFSGHREWVTETRQHHEERCDVITASLGRGACSAHDLVSAVWTRPLAPFHHRFAVFEVLAHLEYLRRLGRVFEETRNGQSMWGV